jgi:hypothetical protein
MTRARSAKAQGRHKVSPVEYARFISGIELTTLWLQSAEMRNEHGPEQPDHVTVDLHKDGRWDPQPGGFRAFHHWRVRVESTKSILARLDVTFGLDFTAETPLTGDLFEVFCEHNLPVNTWPYLREFVSASLARMGWSPLTLPTLKRGVPPQEEQLGDGSENGAAAVPPKRTRSKRLTPDA